jgi:hypothetical protein
MSRGYKAFGPKMPSKNMMNHYRRAASPSELNQLKYLGKLDKSVSQPDVSKPTRRRPTDGPSPPDGAALALALDVMIRF